MPSSRRVADPPGDEATGDLTIAWLDELGREDVDRAGGKGANLGELVALGAPVPPGFVVCTEAFESFVETSGLRAELLGGIEGLQVDDSKSLVEVSNGLQQRLLEEPLPEAIEEQLRRTYQRLGERVQEAEPFVAVRSSATVEDMPESSFAGMNESYLNVRGADALIEAVRNCWASLYGARVIFYRRKLGIPEEDVGIAVVVQRMVDAEAAGVMFTVDPARGDRRTLVIEGAKGLGDVVVGGSVSPDHWEIDKDTLAVVTEQISQKTVKTHRDDQGAHCEVALSDDEGSGASLTPQQVIDVARLGLTIERHFGVPQDIEWAVVSSRTFIVQSRPLTGLHSLTHGSETPRASQGGVEIVRGMGASPGLRWGTARVLDSLADSDRLAEGEILVTRRTEPDWTPLMKRAAAIVTDEGGVTAHAAIVSRELGIPCVVGTREGTARIVDGSEVTVDGRRGVVLEGRRDVDAPAAAPSFSAGRSSATATSLYVNLAQPERLEECSLAAVDGVGLLRLEFMFLAVTDNQHPRKLIQEGKGDQLCSRLAEELARFARAFHPRPVVARTSDFRSNEYRNMEGGAELEPEEANPMIGYRGVYRYINEPDLFRLELDAFRRVRQDMGLDNLILMLPFVRTLSELRACKQLINEAGLNEDGELPLWIMAEVPSVIYRLSDYVAEGVSGVSIGSNDLTQLMLGVDRDSEVLAPLFQATDKAVIEAMRSIISQCRELGISCSICGQAPSMVPALTRKLVEWGIDSISVNPDAIDRTRELIASAEKSLLLEAARSALSGK